MQAHPEFDSPRARRDAGVTLPELLVSVLISGVLMFAITTAFLVMLRTSDEATVRLAESKDITFVQTWLPVDLSSAIETSDDPNDTDVQAELAALSPRMDYTIAPGLYEPTSSAQLPGTNVLTIVRPDLELGSGEYFVVVYRYEEVDGEWQLSRWEIRNPGGHNGSPQEVSRVGVAHEVASPPTGWNPGEAPTHAVEVNSRNQVVLRPIGEDVIIKFESGDTFETGGAGLSSESELPADYSGGFSDPSAPPSRCGGRIAMVIDTSGSVPAGFGGVPTEQAAVGFIDAFTGTPTTLTLNGFDREGYGMIYEPSTGAFVTNGERAPFVSLLNDDTDVQGLRTRVTGLDDLDGAWPGGGSTLPTAGSPRDPDPLFGVHWDQIGSGTNWEDGLFTLLYQGDGSNYSGPSADLVVFITDGQPGLVRGSSGAAVSASQSDAAAAAAVHAETARSQGARVIGLMVGNKANNSTYVGLLSQVVGDREWNGSVASDGTIDIGNALTADYFRGGFDELGGMLRSIMIAECGGTITLQKRIADAPASSTMTTPASGVWSYSTTLGDRELDRDQTSSITFDYIFADGEVSKAIQIVEQPVAGYVWDRAECSANGSPVTADLNADGSAGATVTIGADKALSCLMISTPAP